MKPPVGTFGTTLAGKHTGRIFSFAFKRKNAGRIGKLARDILFQQPFQDFAPAFKARQAHLGHPGVCQRFGMRGHFHLFAPHFVNILRTGIRLFLFFPGLQHPEIFRVDLQQKLFVSLAQLSSHLFFPGFFHLFDGLFHAVQLLRHICLLFGPFVVTAHGFGNLRKVPYPLRRNDVDLFRHFGQMLQMRMKINTGALFDGFHNGHVQPVDARVVKLRSNGTVNRHVVQILIKKLMVALVLFFHIAQSVQSAAFVKFVKGNQVGIVQHVDFFQLAGRAVFGGHHVKGDVAVVHNGRVRLTDAGSFEDDQVETGRLGNGFGIFYIF